ncbi:hypothetical protein [Phormidesmis priestleyi]|nr:hypothetical protein [Phormidesmis priestleyi]
MPLTVAKLTDLDSNYREMAETDADFDKVRSDGCSFSLFLKAIVIIA